MEMEGEKTEKREERSGEWRRERGEKEERGEKRRGDIDILHYTIDSTLIKDLI